MVECDVEIWPRPMYTPEKELHNYTNKKREQKKESNGFLKAPAICWDKRV